MRAPTKEQIQDLRELILLETEAYKAMLKKLQLQANANQQEIQYYRKEMQLSEQKISRLSGKTKNLQHKLQTAELKRSNNEEYSKIVDEFLKPRKINIKKKHLDYDSYEGLSIQKNKEKISLDMKQKINSDSDPYEVKLVILDTSRKDFILQNQHLKSEISDLEVLQSIYHNIWDQRKKNFESFIQSLDQFKRNILDDNMEIDTIENAHVE